MAVDDRPRVPAAGVNAEARGLTALGVPRLGAGIGGLYWPDVERTLRELGESSPVELSVVELPYS